MREFIAICKQMAKEKGIKLDEDDLIGYLEGTNKYEEAIQNEQASAVELQIAQLNLDASIEEINKVRVGIKEYLKECIETNAINAPQMKEFAKQIIALEKEDDMYKAEDWDWFTD